MHSSAPARVQQKQAVRQINRLAADEARIDALLERDPDGGHGFDYPSRTTRRALRPEVAGPNVERQNRSDARPRSRKGRARAVRNARIAARNEQRRADKYGRV